MKDRILHGWNLMRVLYLIMGIVIVIQSIMAHQYQVLFFGLYFIATSIMGLGCAGGACTNPVQASKSKNRTNEEVTFEEVK